MRAERGQSLAELALAVPVLLVLVLGSLQLGLLAYAAALGRFAAFAALRSVAAIHVPDRQPAAVAAARAILERAPGLRLLELTLHPVPLPLRGVAMTAGRLRCALKISTPRLLPWRRLGIVEARAVLPMEPAW